MKRLSSLCGQSEIVVVDFLGLRCPFEGNCASGFLRASRRGGLPTKPFLHCTSAASMGGSLMQGAWKHQEEGQRSWQSIRVRRNQQVSQAVPPRRRRQQQRRGDKPVLCVGPVPNPEPNR